MTHFAIVHDFECTPQAFWKVFFHEPYNVEVYDRIGVKERRFLERTEDEHTIRFALRIMPKRDLPAIIKKIVGGDLGYTEISTYYKGKDTLDVRIEPTLLKERTKMKAVYRLEPLGEGRVRRVFEGDVNVDLPIVGKKVEATVLEDVKRSYDIAAVTTREWLKRDF